MEIAQSLSQKTLTNDFINAVASVKTAWNLLVYESRRVELSGFSDAEQKKISLARDLIDIAMNSSSSSFERQSAYKRAMHQLKGLIILPDRVVNILETSVNKKELTS